MAVAEHKGTARYRELLCVYLAIVADAVTSNVVAPYAQEWVLHTFQMDNIGLYTGILVGSMAFARALSSPFFGWLSYSIGRRLLMAGGLLAAGSLTLGGGLCQRFWLTFTFRFLAGLLNPTETVATAAIGDLATGQERKVAFRYSKAASPVVLGLVANAAQEARLPVLTFLFLTCGYSVGFLALRGVPRAVLEGEV